jgi:hypothetical protein
VNRLVGRLRMSVRQLMIAIASVGLILGSGLWVARVWPIVIERRQAASIEGFWAANWLRISGLSERSLVIVKRLPITPVWKESLRGMDTIPTDPFIIGMECSTRAPTRAISMSRSVTHTSNIGAS